MVIVSHPDSSTYKDENGKVLDQYPVPDFQSALRWYIAMHRTTIR